MAVEPPPDRPFRRSLLILLVVIGTISASSFFYARDAHNGEKSAAEQRDTLSRQLDTVLKNQASQQAAATSREQAAARRQKQLEQAIAAFLAGSSDPAVAGPLRDLGYTPAPSAPSAGRRTTPAPTPTRSSTPSPQPKPSPAPAPSPTALVCVGSRCVTIPPLPSISLPSP